MRDTVTLTLEGKELPGQSIFKANRVEITNDLAISLPRSGGRPPFGFYNRRYSVHISDEMDEGFQVAHTVHYI
jgi:hypothetical protein